MNIQIFSAITILCLVWSSLWGLVKHSLQIFPPFLFISVRLMIAALTLILIQRYLKKSILPAKAEWWKLIIASFMICIGFYASQIFAMQFVDSGLSAVLVFSMPIFVAVLGHYFLNERMNRQKSIGLIFGVSALIAILWPHLFNLHADLSLLGQGLLILSGLSWAAVTVYVKKHFSHYDKIKLTIWQLLIGGVVIFIAALVFEPIQRSVWTDPFNTLLVLYIAVFGTGLAFLLWNWIVGQVDTFIASISVMSIPILSLVFGHVFWNEAIGLHIMIGALFIALGIICSALKINNTEKSVVLYKGQR